jgi:hypothetical protein
MDEIADWGLGIADWGLGIGDCGLKKREAGKSRAGVSPAGGERLKGKQRKRGFLSLKPQAYSL